MLCTEFGTALRTGNWRPSLQNTARQPTRATHLYMSRILRFNSIFNRSYQNVIKKDPFSCGAPATDWAAMGDSRAARDVPGKKLIKWETPSADAHP